MYYIRLILALQYDFGKNSWGGLIVDIYKTKKGIYDFNEEVTKFIEKTKAWDFSFVKQQLNGNEEAIDKWINKLGLSDEDFKSFLKTWDGIGDVSQSYQQWMVTNGKATSTFSSFTQKANSVLKSLGAALGSMAIMYAIGEVIQLISECASASDRLRDSAEKLGNTFSSTKSEISDYKTKIEDLYEVINDNSSSYEDTYNARQELLTIQDEMIEKFGSEAEAVSLVTAAINGQTEALETLTQNEWNEVKNAFNNPDQSWTKNFGDAWANLWSGSSDNFNRMVKKMEDTEVSFHIFPLYGDETYEEFSDKLKENFGASITRTERDDMFTLSGDLNDIYKQLQNIQSLAQDMGIDDSFLTDLSHQATETKNTLDGYEEIYNQHILYDKVFEDTTSLNNAGETYEEVFYNIKNAYKEYQEAFASGDKELIAEAKQNFAEIIQSGIEGIDDQSVVDFFNSMYPDLQDVVGGWEFEVAFKAAVENDNDNFENDVKDAVGKFNTVEDIQNYNPKVATEEQKNAYSELEIQNFKGVHHTL